MSGVDEEQIPAGTARTFHPGCVGGAGVELCGRLLAEFIAPGQLEPMLPCNFSWSNLMCLGMWLQSALRNTSLSMVTLIPPFLFSPVKNKEERNLAFIGSVLLVPLVLGGTTPTLSCQRGKPEQEHLPRHQDCKVWQGCWDICPLFWVSPIVLGQETGLTPSSSTERGRDDGFGYFPALGVLLP